MALRVKINLMRITEHGVVAEIKEDVVHVTGLTNCMYGQLVKLGNGGQGVIVGFDPNYVLVLLVHQDAPIKPGDKAVTMIEEFKIPVGEKFVGRRVNALARPIDGGPPIREQAFYPLFNQAPSVLERVPLDKVLATGTKIVDMLKPVGKGQRMLIVGDRVTGKTAVGIDAILSQRGQNVICIYCAIGKSEAALNKVIEVFHDRNVWEYGIIVAAKASDPMGQQYLAPYAAASLGEYFMYEHGADVLVVFDDFTKHAWAWRQISLLLERAPGRDAYPGDIFYIHSQLVERAGRMGDGRGGGSMTHLPIVETLQGNVAGYIPSNIISMTDGQIYMSAPLFAEGFKPAIDMGLSVSRIGNRVQWKAMKGLTGMLQLEFVRYKELEKLTRIKAGASADVTRRLKQGRNLEEMLKQGENSPVPLEEQVVLLYALQRGMLKEAEPATVRNLIDTLLARVRLACPEMLERLRTTQQITDKDKEELDVQIARFQDPAVQPADPGKG